MLLEISVGDTFSEFTQYVSRDEEHFSTKIKLPLIKFFIEPNRDDALRFVYPELFDTPDLHKRALLAGTNEDVNEWNEHIQSLNPSAAHTLTSTNTFHVDDPFGYFDSMLNEHVLSKYGDHQSPPHKLTLKCNDICLLTRSLRTQTDNIATNTRVKILSVSKYCVQVIALDSTDRRFCIPRFHFKVRLPYGQSYPMIRKQFPLRLAYCMTYNKSQGQEFQKILIDVRKPVFSHGFLYVGNSRIRNSQDIAYYCTSSQIQDESPIVENVVYPKLLID